MTKNMKTRLENPEHLKALAAIVGEDAAKDFSADCSRCDLTIQEVLEDGLDSLIREQEHRRNPLIFDPRETRPECDRGEEGLKRFLALTGRTPEEIFRDVTEDYCAGLDHPWKEIARRMISPGALGDC